MHAPPVPPAAMVHATHTIALHVRQGRAHWRIFRPPSGDEGMYVSIVAGPDGAMWLTDATGRLVRVDASGGRTALALQFTSKGTQHTFLPGNAAVGSDGNLYVTGCVDSPLACAFIGVTDAKGHISVHPIPSGASARYSGLALGPDGNVWFADAKAVGKITPSGKVSEYKYPSGEVTNELSGVATGPDGKLWFTEVDKLTVGNVDPATGNIVEYSAASQSIQCGFSGMAAGPDGKLYAACGAGVVQIGIDGTMYYLEALQGLSTGAQEIANATGNLLWFAFLSSAGWFDPSQAQLVLYTPPDGAVTLYASAIGPDSKQWFMAENGTIYVVSPPPSKSREPNP